MKYSEGQLEEAIEIGKQLLRQQLDTNRELDRLNTVVDIQRKQIKKLIRDKAELLSELNALYRAGGHK